MMKLTTLFLCVILSFASVLCAMDDMLIRENEQVFSLQTLLQHPLVVACMMTALVYAAYFHLLYVLFPIVYCVVLSAEVLSRLFQGNFSIGMDIGLFPSPLQAALKQENPTIVAWESTKRWMTVIENYLNSRRAGTTQQHDTKDLMDEL